MLYPTLKEMNISRQVVDTFRGYNHNLRISDGEFFDMKNMTSDVYPILSPRGRRGVYASPAAPGGMIPKDKLCYVDGGDFVMGEERIAMGLNSQPKQLISMGAYVIIMPDKKYINTADTSDFGEIEGAFHADDQLVSFSPCTSSGDGYSTAHISPSAPEGPEDQALWVDTSNEDHVLKRYCATSEMWVSISATYIKISCPGIGKPFKQYDGVTISGIRHEDLQNLNGTAVVWGCGDDYIIISGLIDNLYAQEDRPVLGGEGGFGLSVERAMPNMDFIIESENRLWGCRYGIARNGETVNEIYASKLGDFRNWNCFMGISIDSYVASCGTDGPFTGAITHMGHPLFFKENCVHKVYGNYPGNFQIQTTACRGVQKGSHRSLAIVHETLLYKSIGGICAYDGSLPAEVSYALGNEAYSDAVGGALGGKYYVSMKDSAGKWHLFVYRSARGMWHREDNLRADCFCAYGGELYAVEHDSGRILTMCGSGEPGENRVSWMAQTGLIGTDMPGTKYVSGLLIRMALAIGTRVRFLVQYDSIGGWEHLSTITGTSLRSFSIPIRPRRCDHLRLRIEGEGDAKLYSITKTIEKGSDTP